MFLGLGLNFSPDLGEMEELLKAFSRHLEQEFKGFVYSDKLQSIAIGIICVEPKFDFFFTPKAPVFVKSKTYREGELITKIDKTFQYELKLDYAIVKSLDKPALIEYLKNVIGRSLGIIEEHVKDKIDNIEGFKSKFLGAVGSFKG